MTKTILCMGQSNGVGGDTSSLGAFDIHANVTCWDNTTDLDGASDIGSQWIAPARGYAPLPSTGANNMFAHACSVMAGLIDPEPVRFISVCRRGKRITEWTDAAGDPGAQYDRMEAVAAAASVTSFDAFFWMQGESDDENHEEYADTWALLVANLQADGYISSTTPIVIGEVSKDRSAEINAVFAGLQRADIAAALAGGTRRLAVASLRALATIDDTHFTNSAMPTAGLRIVKALSALDETYAGIWS